MMQMKYIVTCNGDGLEEIFLFLPTINHDAMAEAVSHIKDRRHRVSRQAISAGFVARDGTCCGVSQSLGLAARPKDTQLLAMFMGG